MSQLPEHLESIFNEAVEHININFGKVYQIIKLKGLSNYNFLIKYDNQYHDIYDNQLVLKILNLNAVTQDSDNNISYTLSNLKITPKLLYNKFPHYYLIEYKEGTHPNRAYFTSTAKIVSLATLIGKLHNLNYSNYSNLKTIDFYKTNTQLLDHLDKNDKHVTMLRYRLDKITEEIKKFPTTLGFCHNDLNNENIIIDKKGTIWLIDFEYSGISDIFFDLASLKNHFIELHYKQLLQFYLQNYLPNLSSETFYLKLSKYSILGLLTESTWYLYMSKQDIAKTNPYYRKKFLDTLLLLKPNYND